MGPGHPVFIVAEIGINHNGDPELARELIIAAHSAGCDAVKFQKRTPHLAVPESQHALPKETPWGLITYLEYKEKLELDLSAYEMIDRLCREIGIPWFASCWDEESVDFIERFDPPCYKIASASLTDDSLLKYKRSKKRPLIASTGMSSIEQIDHAIEVLGREDLVILHSTSNYPARLEELNLRVIPRLAERYGVPVGYSGHEVGLYTSLAAVVMGASLLERHFTLDRAMWGTDQAASVEPQGMARLVKDVRAVEEAFGDGQKIVYESELPIIEKLRRIGR